MRVNFKRLHPMAKIPCRGTDFSAGYDLTATSVQGVGDMLVCGTGLACEIPQGYFGAIYARSSIYLTGLEKVGGVCVIDADYRGEIFVLFRRVARSWEDVQVLKHYLSTSGQENKLGMMRPYAVGDRIAQLVIQPCADLEFVERAQLSVTARGSGGYGSTGGMCAEGERHERQVP